MSEWRDIKTAPKTGCTIWLAEENNMRLGFWPFWDDDPEKVTGRCWADFCENSCGGGPIGLHFEPTHWMPLPEPPQAHSAGE